MGFVAAKCTQCGAAIEVDDTKDAGVCRHCGTAFVTEKAINNYNSYITQHIVKNIYGKEKTDAEEYIANGETFLKLGDWDRARAAFLRASEESPGNYKAWLGLMRSETKEFTDLNDTKHKEHYRRALAVANKEETAIIERICGQFLERSKKYQAKRLEFKETKTNEDFLKTNNKKILRGLIIYALAFLISTVLFCALSVPAIRDGNIAKNPDLPIVRASFKEVDPVRSNGRYRILYAYNYDGETVEKWSKYDYSFATVEQYEQRGYLEIRISKSGRAVDIKYRAGYSAGFLWGAIIASIGWLVSVIFLIIYIRAFIEYRISDKIMKNGINSTGVFIESKPHGPSMHKIEISFKDAAGNKHKIWAHNVYTLGAVIAAKDMKEIPIQILGKRALIRIAVVDQYLQNNKERLLNQ